MTNSQFNQLMAGMKSAENAKAAEFDPMKGRTYIPRLSPEMNKALVDALKARLNKRADKKMSKRKKASDDYFAGEADKAMAAERKARSDREMANEADKRMSELSEQADIDATDREGEMNRLYEYGAEGRAETIKAKQKAAEERAGKSNRIRYTPEQIREDNERRAKEGKEPRSNTDRFLAYLGGKETSTQKEDNTVVLKQYQLDHLNEMNARRKEEGLDPLSQSEYFLLGDDTESSTQKEDREERRKQQDVRDLDREDITSEEIEQDELNRRNPMLAMQLRLAEEQRFKDKKKRVQDKKQREKQRARDKRNFSQDRSNIRRYRSDRSLAQSDRQDLGGVSFNRNQRIFEDFQRRNMLRKARAENAARNVRRYRP